MSETPRPEDLFDIGHFHLSTFRPSGGQPRVPLTVWLRQSQFAQAVRALDWHRNSRVEENPTKPQII